MQSDGHYGLQGGNDVQWQGKLRRQDGTEAQYELVQQASQKIVTGLYLASHRNFYQLVR